MQRRPDGDVAIRTFLIADIRGSTAYGQMHGDEALSRLAAGFAEIMREGVEAHGGEVVELRGDEALAVFASARAALAGAAELQLVLADETHLHPELPLHVGMGIDAGEAVPVEDGFRGGALNLAARLCSRAAAGEILASPGVVHIARAVPGLTIVEGAPLALKGLDEPVTPLLVTAADSTSAAPHVGADAASTLPSSLGATASPSGRQIESRRLRWAWRLARHGRREVVVVTGAPGLGKSLVAAEAAFLAGVDGAPVVHVRCKEEPGALAAALGEISGPAVVIADDVDAAPAADLDSAARHDAEAVLLVATCVQEPAALAARGDRRTLVHLEPLGPDAVEEIAASSGLSPAELNIHRILAETGGVPERVHRAVAEAAREHASRKLAASASAAAKGWADLRDRERRLTRNVLDLQLAREQLATAVGGADSGCPYMGLASFDVTDADRFFGRERLVAELVTRLARATLLGVVGPSGSGKSSVIRAGLVPTVATGVLPGSAEWARMHLRPGAHPLRELDRAVWAGMPERHRSALEGTELPLRSLREVLGPDERVLVVVDQFEEAYTVCDDEAERDAFVRALVEAATEPQGRFAVVLAIRADYYGRCASDSTLAELLGENHVLVGAMTADEYHRAIELPAQHAGVRLDPPLVDALVADAGDQAGALPLLSTALVELWQRREGAFIPLRAYLDTGGVSGAVARLAEETFAGFTERQRDVARSVLLRLTGSGEGDTVVRRRAPLDELDQGDADIAHVLRALTGDRLLTAAGGTIEVAHEALLREWPRLRDWVEEDREGRRLREHLITAAREWDDSGREAAELYRGARLGAALDWTAEHTLELNELEQAFLAESRAAAEAETLRQRRANRRLRGLLVGVGILLVLAVIAGGAALVARNDAQDSATAATAQRLGAQALVEKDLDRSLLLAREGTALDASSTTYGNLQSALVRSPAAIAVRRLTAGRPQNVVTALEGALVSVGDNGDVVTVLDGNTAETLYDTNGFVGMFSVDGATMVTPTFGDSGGLVYHRARTGERIRRVPWPEGMEAFHVSADLGTLITVERSGTRVAFYDVTGERPKPTGVVAMPADRPALDVFFLPDGRQYYTVNHVGAVPPDGPQQLVNLYWRVGQTSPDHDYPGNPETEGPIALAPDSRTVLITDEQGSVELLDVPTGKRRQLLGRPGSGIFHAAFSADGRLLATGGEAEDPAVLLWDVQTGELLQRLEGHNGGVHGLGFLPDGRTLYTSSLDGSVMAWDLEGSRRLFARPFAAGSGVIVGNILREPGAALSPDGRLLAVSQAEGGVVVRRAGDGGVAARLDVGDGHAGAVEFSPDGRVLAAGAPEGDVRLFDTTNWREIGPPLSGLVAGSPLDIHVNALAFSPDGSSLAAAVAQAAPVDGAPAPDLDGRAVVWNLDTGRPAGEPIELPGPTNDVAFSPDGGSLAAAYDVLDFDAKPEDGIEPGGYVDVVALETRETSAHLVVDEGVGAARAVAFLPNGLVVTGGGSGDVRFWDPGTGQQSGRLVKVSAGFVLDLDVAPDGASIVTSGTDGTVRVVDVARRVQLGSPFQANDSWVNAELSSDGEMLYAVYEDGDGYAWRTARASWDDHGCRVAGRNLTRDEWETFLPGREYAPSCPFPVDPAADADQKA